MIPRRVMLFSVLLLVVVVSSSAWAQFTSGIEGTVTDPTGAVVSGATVTIENEETGATQTFQTQESGSFRFTTLPSSAFSISVAASGFKTTVQEHSSTDHHADIESLDFCDLQADMYDLAKALESRGQLDQAAHELQIAQRLNPALPAPR